ncbi:hypothetical protein PF008_g21996 [Phytophthora fragariae]|uniref:Uncharacterized protein n=1 Tax=Phytophthora fragariae TaxID=53985 RepID=A0A6G0QUY9_9STRA|nr:hypothetical protein PF008_g21996 [Phytophthora fragariae]
MRRLQVVQGFVEPVLALVARHLWRPLACLVGLARWGRLHRVWLQQLAEAAGDGADVAFARGPAVGIFNLADHVHRKGLQRCCRGVELVVGQLSQSEPRLPRWGGVRANGQGWEYLAPITRSDLGLDVSHRFVNGVVILARISSSRGRVACRQGGGRRRRGYGDTCPHRASMRAALRAGASLVQRAVGQSVSVGVGLPVDVLQLVPVEAA